jgi:hypothetical protein
MPTVQPEAQPSTHELLKAVEKLPPPELEYFVTQVLNLRAQRVVPALPEAEAELLDQIAGGTLPQDQHRRFHELRRKLGEETITPAEHTEFLRLSDEMERRNARRVDGLIKLAQLRKKSLEALMEELGVKPCTDE